MTLDEYNETMKKLREQAQQLEAARNQTLAQMDDLDRALKAAQANNISLSESLHTAIRTGPDHICPQDTSAATAADYRLTRDRAPVKDLTAANEELQKQLEELSKKYPEARRSVFAKDKPAAGK